MNQDIGNVGNPTLSHHAKAIEKKHWQKINIEMIN